MRLHRSAVRNAYQIADTWLYVSKEGIYGRRWRVKMASAASNHPWGKSNVELFEPVFDTRRAALEYAEAYLTLNPLPADLTDHKHRAQLISTSPGRYVVRASGRRDGVLIKDLDSHWYYLLDEQDRTSARFGSLDSVRRTGGWFLKPE